MDLGIDLEVARGNYATELDTPTLAYAIQRLLTVLHRLHAQTVVS